MRRSADSLTTPSGMKGQAPQVKRQETLAVWFPARPDSQKRGEDINELRPQNYEGILLNVQIFFFASLCDCLLHTDSSLIWRSLAGAHQVGPGQTRPPPLFFFKR